MYRLIIFIILIIISLDVLAISKIYLIRHAEVQIENPGWCRSETAIEYKKQYNKNHIQEFKKDIVLEKIDSYRSIDTVFCSPQKRAIETANAIFNKSVILNINDNLMELDYPVINMDLIKLPLKVWLTISFIKWIAGNNVEGHLSYKEKKHKLESYSDELIAYAETNKICVVIAHGMLNRELIKILKNKGWRLEYNEGLKFIC